MFKVECPGCKAPYQVDERRVPASGLKMRCPKCGSSFQVDPPPADPRSTAPASVLGAALGFVDTDESTTAPPRPALPKKKPAVKGTMIGMAPQAAPRPGAAPPRSASPDAPPTEADLPALAAEVGTEAEADGQDPFAELDLPATVQKRTLPQSPNAKVPAATIPVAPVVPARGPLPVPAARGAAAPTPPSAPKTETGPEDADLPSPAGPPLPQRRPPPTRPQGSPAAQAARARPAAQTVPVASIPSSPPDPFGELDLPARGSAPRAEPPAPQGNRTLTGHADLPSVPGAQADLPSPAKPAAAKPPVPAANRAPAAGKPAMSRTPVAPIAAVAPSAPGKQTAPIAPPVDLPSPKAGPAAFDLPSVRTGSAGQEFDLPASAEAALPQVLSGGVGLPALSFGDDLPSPSMGVELPSVSGGVGLPNVKATQPIGGFGELDLPMAGADLPEPVAAGLPEVGGNLPMNAAGLPVATDDPFARSLSPPPDFGHQMQPDPFGDASSGDPFGATEADPFGGAQASLPPVQGRDPFAQGSPNRTAQGPFGSFAPEAPNDGEFSPPEEPPPDEEPQEVVRQAGGGTDYGEVNLDDGGHGGVSLDGDEGFGEPADGLSGQEFDALPVEGPGAIPGPAMRARVPVAGAGSAVAEIQAKRRKQRLRIAFVSAVVVVLAGGALTAVPSVGPFGVYFVIDQVRHGEYERILTNASDSAHRALGADTYPDADTALKAVVAAADQARRFKPLAAYSAFVGFGRMLRFGGESDVYARAKVALDELADVHDIDKLTLARAAKAGVDGDLARARQMLGTLKSSSPRDIDVAVVQGEVELKARDGNAALAAWKTAAALEKSARTSYGLARATLLGGDADGASKLAEQALQQNPHHVGARLMLAQNVWRARHDEAAATKYLDAVVKEQQFAGPEERIETQTLLGDIHLARGRISLAEKSYGEAIKIAEVLKASTRAARALSGLGEALFRAGRYSQAIARFKAAAQADPDYVTAQVGVAKSSLELERLEEARDMLAKLRKVHPTEMSVDYWYGRAQEALGDRKEAEVAYRDAIEAGKGDADAVDSYIALAGVLSQEGQADAANTTLADAQKRLPESPALHKALGRVAMAQGRYSDGLAAYQKALSLDPEDIEAKFLVGSALTRQHEFDKALEIFDAVGKIDRDFPGLALERGILYQESGRTEEALREYEAALAKAPNDPDLMLRVGCGKADGNGAEAEKMLRKVLEQRPTSPETHFCIGRAMMAKQDIADALKSFERAVQLDPNRAEYHLYVGWAANEAGSLAKAGASLKRALDLDQGLADAYWQRGVLRFRQTRSKDAVEDLLKALSLRPSRVEAHADLALAYNDLGKEDLALAEWQKAIAAKPDQATWRYHYGKLLNLRLQNAAAAEQLGKAIDLATSQGGSQPWLSEAHRLCAISLGMVPAAIPHWQAFLKTGASNSPYRNDAKLALKRMGARWEED